jgi:hypothetical protein
MGFDPARKFEAITLGGGGGCLKALLNFGYHGCLSAPFTFSAAKRGASPPAD